MYAFICRGSAYHAYTLLLIYFYYSLKLIDITQLESNMQSPQSETISKEDDILANTFLEYLAKCSLTVLGSMRFSVRQNTDDPYKSYYCMQLYSTEQPKPRETKKPVSWLLSIQDLEPSFWPNFLRSTLRPWAKRIFDIFISLLVGYSCFASIYLQAVL